MDIAKIESYRQMQDRDDTSRRNTGLPPIVTATVADFCRLSGIGRSKVYELIGAGDIDSIKIGTCRLILLESYRRLIEQRCISAVKPERCEILSAITATAPGRPKHPVAQEPGGPIGDTLSSETPPLAD